MWGRVNMPDIDLFDVYRMMLATVCMVYALARILQSLWGWLAYFSGSRQTAILGRYVAVQLLRLRAKQFAFDAVQVVVLTIVFLGLVYAHHAV
jgi:hypothetical protein